MTPEDAGPAIAELLMLCAGPGDEATIARIGDLFVTFDSRATLTRLACETAAAAAGKLEHAAGVLTLADAADVAGFRMMIHAAEHGPAHLDAHLELLPDAHVAEIAVGLLSLWRQVCSIAAVRALAGLRIPATVPEGIG